MHKPSNGSILDRLPLLGNNTLSPLGEKIFLDRYALKDGSKSTLQTNDLVVALVDSATGQREIGTAQAFNEGNVQVVLRDGTTLELPLEHVDKPVELTVEQMMDRAARGPPPSDQHPERQVVRELPLAPGLVEVRARERILTAWHRPEPDLLQLLRGPSPGDSRDGIIETLSQMAEIMGRGGGVASTCHLRPLCRPRVTDAPPARSPGAACSAS